MTACRENLGPQLRAETDSNFNLISFCISYQNNNFVHFYRQKINYAKCDSDVIAKMKGTFKERTHKKKDDEKKKRKKEVKAAAAAANAAAAAAANTAAAGVSLAAGPGEMFNCLFGYFVFGFRKILKMTMKI